MEKTLLKAVVLAAGKGTRMLTEDSDAPKVMKLVCGKPLLSYVLNALTFIEKRDIIVVAGYKKDEIINSFHGYAFAVQEEQLGTGHAVMAAEDELSGFDGSVLVCYGDMPVVKRESYEELVRTHFDQGNDCTILTGESESALSFGRIVRSGSGDFLAIVEERDCTPDQLEITELNSGVYVFRAPMLLQALKKINSNNSQGEYYLTDAPAIMRGEGAKIGLLRRNLGDEIIGVNTTEQLAQVERILNEVA